MKYLRVTMPDGSKWDVPAEVIARNQALNYAGGDDRTPEWKEEFEAAMKADQLKDWAANNMNWSDVYKVAQRVTEPLAPDFREGWMNGVKEVVEVN